MPARLIKKTWVTTIVACFFATLTFGLSAVRGVSRLDKPARLPVWPVLNGLVACGLDLLGLENAAAWIEEKLGGRVCPMMLDAVEADPFVLLVHHRHAFDAWDPIRPLFRLLLPEGFPAHPHRGFETVTVTISGGLAHRDSVGVAEKYSDGDVQWLTAGIGMLHEEMWWHPQGRDCELYQLWVNSPSAAKSVEPQTIVLRGPELETIGVDGYTETLLGGKLGVDGDCTGPTRADVRLSRLTMGQKTTYTIDLPQNATALVYARQGQVLIGNDVLPRHRLAYTTRDGDVLRIHNSHTSVADLLLLIACPLREPLVASGTWVVSDYAELEIADADYRAGRMGIPWDHSISDDDWRAWIRRYPHRL